MKKLLKTYELNCDMQYFEMIAESFLNGNFTQAIEQFRAMPKINRIEFLKATTIGDWNSGIAKNKLSHLFDSL